MLSQDIIVNQLATLVLATASLVGRSPIEWQPVIASPVVLAIEEPQTAVVSVRVISFFDRMTEGGGH